LALRPMPLLFRACAVPCLADVSQPQLRLNDAWFRLLVAGDHPQLAVGLPVGAFPVGGDPRAFSRCRVPITAISEFDLGDMAYSSSLVPLASFSCWRGRSTAGPSH